MIKDITIGQYVPGESLLHKADPRVKIILAIVFMTTLLLVKSYVGFAVFSLFTLFIILTAGISVKYTLKGLKPIMFIMAFTAVVNIFTIKGTPVFEYGFVHITYEGIELSVKTALRLTLLIIGASMLTLTTTPISLTDGIEKLIGPLRRFGVPAHEIAMMMSIAIRFIPTLLDETDKIMKAQASRGADFDTGNFMQRAKSFVPVLVPLFISAFRRADELATAMEARCYRGSVGRTRMKQLKLTSADLIISLVMFVFAVCILYLQYL